MKKIALFLALLMFVLPISANAASIRSVNVSPGLKFEGTSAKCSVLVVGNAGDDEIEIVAKLWRGNSCIATWSESGIGYVNLSKSKTIDKGVEYTLTANVTINGIKQPPVSISRKS